MILALREKLATRACELASQFTWARSVDAFKRAISK